MTANTLSAAYTDMQKEVALALGWPRAPGNWSSNQDADFAIILAKGSRQFYYPPPLPGEQVSHNWSFLYPVAELQLTAAYSTGTIAASVGTITLTSGTFPSWAAEGRIWYTSTSGTKVAAEVVARTSDTSITIDDSGGLLDVASGTSYTLRRHTYDLPDDFGGIPGDVFTYRRDEQWNFSPIKRVSELDIRKLDYEQSGGDHPRMFALQPIAPTTSQSSRWRVTFWPLAEETYYLEYRYHAIPPLLDGSSYIYHYGGAEHSETFIASCVDMAFQTLRDSGERHGHFMERLVESVMHDRRNYTPSYLGTGSRSLGANYGNDRQLLREFRSNLNPSNITLNFG